MKWRKDNLESRNNEVHQLKPANLETYYTNNWGDFGLNKSDIFMN